MIKNIIHVYYIYIIIKKFCNILRDKLNPILFMLKLILYQSERSVKFTMYTVLYKSLYT